MVDRHIHFDISYYYIKEDIEEEEQCIWIDTVHANISIVHNKASGFKHANASVRYGTGL